MLMPHCFPKSVWSVPQVLFLPLLQSLAHNWSQWQRCDRCNVFFAWQKRIGLSGYTSPLRARWQVLFEQFANVTMQKKTANVTKRINDQVAALQSLETGLLRLVGVHYAAGIGGPVGGDMKKQTEVVYPACLMQRLHRFMPDMPELGLEPSTLRAAWVFCATGISQSVLMHVLGIKRSKGPERNAMQKLRDFRELDVSDIPHSHRLYLEKMRERTSVRAQIEQEVASMKIEVQDLSRLETAFNACLTMFAQLHDRRKELVSVMFGVDELKNDWEKEQDLFRNARFKLLLRRRMQEQSSPTR